MKRYKTDLKMTEFYDRCLASRDKPSGEFSSEEIEVGMTRLLNLTQAHSTLRSHVDQLTGREQALQAELTKARERASAARIDIDTWQKVQVLFGQVSEFARGQLKTRVEQTVTAALQAIFEDPRLEFKIELKTQAGKPAAEWQVVSRYSQEDGTKTTVAANPEDARGGGITDVVSLALRLALLELARPKPEGPVLLDEPGKMISAEYVPNLAAFLKQYAQKTGRQIILVTHHEALADVADAAYRVEQRDGISEVVRL